MVLIQVAEAVDVAEVDQNLTIEILSECGLTSVLTVSKGTKSVRQKQTHKTFMHFFGGVEGWGGGGGRGGNVFNDQRQEK